MTFEITRPSTLSPVQGADTWRLLPGAFTHPPAEGRRGRWQGFGHSQQSCCKESHAGLCAHRHFCVSGMNAQKCDCWVEWEGHDSAPGDFFFFLIFGLVANEISHYLLVKETQYVPVLINTTPGAPALTWGSCAPPPPQHPARLPRLGPPLSPQLLPAQPCPVLPQGLCT